MRAKDLFEIHYMNRYSAADAIKKYSNKWIHFTDINKLGINVKKRHTDPHGIYFYPCKYFIDNPITYLYKADSKYYYICDINLNSNGVNLEKITYNEVKDIAMNNGWIDLFNELLHTSKNKSVGEYFYSLLKYSSTANISKEKMLKGIDYILDPGSGTIHQDEPYQLLVLNRKIINIVEFGINKDNIYNIRYNIVKELAEIHNWYIKASNKIITVINNNIKFVFKDNSIIVDYINNEEEPLKIINIPAYLTLEGERDLIYNTVKEYSEGLLK